MFEQFGKNYKYSYFSGKVLIRLQIVQITCAKREKKTALALSSKKLSRFSFSFYRANNRN